MKVAVSFLKSKYDMKETIKLIDESDADYIHVDVMDGEFVLNKNDEHVIKRALKGVNKPLDIHLMVQNPLSYIKYFSTLKPAFLTFHYEAVKDIRNLMKKMKNAGISIGISIRPETKVKEIMPFLKQIDQVLVMSVDPGCGGQEFMEDVLYKISALAELKQEMQASFLISVDGGVNKENISKIKKAGADMVVSGSFVCESDDYQKQIDSLR